MLKKRIISLLTLNDGVLFRTKKFVPDYRYTLNFVDLDLIDEVVILDVTPEGQGDRANFYKTVRDFTDQCAVPLAVGGKIRDLEEVNRLFGELPIEKVVVERGLLEDSRLGRQIAQKWGSQALCQAITARDDESEAERHFAVPDEPCGELLLQNVKRDGSLLGYDLDLLRGVMVFYRSLARNVPIVIGSGCGTWEHMRQAFETGADAAATSCIHHFPPNAIRAAKKYLAEHGVAVRPAA